MAQTVYYVTAAETFADPVTFSVPTGNFGNVLAGWIAREMGAPIRDLLAPVVICIGLLPRARS